jgi:hypothetical protein
MGLAEPKAAIFLNKNAHLFVFDGEEAAAGRVISVGLTDFFFFVTNAPDEQSRVSFCPSKHFRPILISVGVASEWSTLRYSIH